MCGDILKVYGDSETKDIDEVVNLAEYWYTTNYHTSLQCSPFQALYGYEPPMLTLDVRGEYGEQDWAMERVSMVDMLRENLKKAHARMKHKTDKN